MVLSILTGGECSPPLIGIFGRLVSIVTGSIVSKNTPYHGGSRSSG